MRSRRALVSLAVVLSVVLLAVSACHSGALRMGQNPLQVATVEILVPVTVPANRARATFQRGGRVYAADPYLASCELEISTVSARDQRVARDLFVVTRINTAILSDPEARLPLFGPFVDITCGDLIWYEIEYRLASDRQPGVRNLRCRKATNACWGRGGYPDRDAVRQALGVSFRVD